MDVRLVRAALWRRRGMVLLAVLAVAIGGSVASALMHVSGDIERKLSRELRALGPNLIVTPGTATPGRAARVGTEGAPAGFLDVEETSARLARAGVRAAPLLYVAARVKGDVVQVIGTDLDAARALHPGWKIGDGGTPTLVGARLARRLGLAPGEPLTLTGRATRGAGTPARVDIVAGTTLEAGGADDEALWVPLETAQAVAGLPGRASLFQAHVDGGREAAVAARARIERGGGLRAVPIGALTATEGVLLERMRRLMTLVTLAALVAAGLCAFGTLTDLALERRREIALLKALGARRRDVVRQFGAEAVAIGLVGGTSGWLFGLFMAQVIGREVFRSTIAVRWDVPPVVIAMSLGIALLASYGPIRLALAVEPATTLKGD